MGYSEKDSMVRVDFFKPSGKWYCTEAIDFHDLYDDEDIFEACRIALNRQLKSRLKEMTAVILKPYHKNSHPIMLQVWSYDL